MSDVWEVGSARVRDPPTPRRPPTGYARAGRGLALDWPRCTLPAEDLYLSNSVFPLESRDHYFSRKISTGKRKFFISRTRASSAVWAAGRSAYPAP